VSMKDKMVALEELKVALSAELLGPEEQPSALHTGFAEVYR
jgi:hypothetical protein